MNRGSGRPMSPWKHFPSSSESCLMSKLRDHLRTLTSELATRADNFWLQARPLHERQGQPDSHDNGPKHIAMVEHNIWRLIYGPDDRHGRSHLDEFQPVEFFLLSLVACSHDFDKAIDSANKVPRELRVHGRDSGEFVLANQEFFQLASDEAYSIADAISLHDLGPDAFRGGLQRLEGKKALSLGTVDLCRIAVILKAADILQCDLTRVPLIGIEVDQLTGHARAKYLARKCTTGWRINGDRIEIQSRPDSNEEEKAACDAFTYMRDEEWAGPRDSLRHYEFPNELKHSIPKRRLPSTPVDAAKTTAPDSSTDQRLATQPHPAPPEADGNSREMTTESQGPSLGYGGGRVVQVIAWEGWDAQELHGNMSGSLEMLLYEPGFDRLPYLTHTQSNAHKKFDLLIVDLAYLQLNYMQRFPRIKHLKLVDLDTVNIDLAAFLDELTGAVLRQPTIGIPIEFGFSEVLIDPSSFGGDFGDSLKAAQHEFASWTPDARRPTNESSLSYRDFAIDKLVEYRPGLRIGIWDWYLPAMLHLLLMEIKESETIADVIKATPERMKNAIGQLRPGKWDAVFVPLYTLSDINDAVKGRGVDVIIGSGSSALPLNPRRRSEGFIPVVPREGVFMWANCVAAVAEGGSHAGLRSLVETWLSPRTQERLIGRPQYRALPATRAALSTVARTHPTHPALPTLFEVTTGDDFGARDAARLATRKVPLGDFRLWQHEWETMIRRIEAASS